MALDWRPEEMLPVLVVCEKGIQTSENLTGSTVPGISDHCILTKEKRCTKKSSARKEHQPTIFKVRFASLYHDPGTQAEPPYLE